MFYFTFVLFYLCLGYSLIFVGTFPPDVVLSIIRVDRITGVVNPNLVTMRFHSKFTFGDFIITGRDGILHIYGSDAFIDRADGFRRFVFCTSVKLPQVIWDEANTIRRMNHRVLGYMVLNSNGLPQYWTKGFPIPSHVMPNIFMSDTNAFIHVINSLRSSNFEAEFQTFRRDVLIDSTKIIFTNGDVLLVIYLLFILIELIFGFYFQIVCYQIVMYWLVSIVTLDAL